MTDQEIIRAILSADSNLIEACEIETDTSQLISRKYQFDGGLTVRYRHTPFAVYPQGVALNSMPKDQIEVIEPDQRIIYKTDWIDELASD